MGVMIAKPELCAFLDISCNIQQNMFLLNLVSTLEEKTLFTAEKVSFHLHFGGTTLLF